MLWKIHRSKREEVTEDLRELHSGKLQDFYYSLNIFWVNRTGMIKWRGGGILARRGRTEMKEEI
jgi:hypothetical protein